MPFHKHIKKSITCFWAILLFAGVTIFAACDANRVFEQTQNINNTAWLYEQIPQFKASIADTNQLYNVDLQIRHNTSYLYSNIYLKLTTTYPSGKKSTSQINLVLAEKDGKWKGSGMGSTYTLPFNIQQNAKFPEKGDYTFAIEQDMRDNPLAGVMAVGIRIEKAVNK